MNVETGIIEFYLVWEMFFLPFRDGDERNAGLRIDHFLLSPHVDKRLVAGGVDRMVRGCEKSSDHAPVWIELSE